MSYKKTTLVTDTIHGSIPLSPCEKILISTEVYNRLHNVLQNSVVYFTFPSNRTSRFIHSLGCLKITGNLFRYGLLNAKDETRGEFFREANETLKSVAETAEFKKDIQSCHFHEITPEQLKEKDPEELRCQLYTSALYPHLNKTEEYLFIVFYQAIRFAALLHDVGHPPFSHVTEYAITAIYDWLETKNEKNSKSSELQEHLGRFMRDGKAFHETLGLTISEFLLDQVVDNYSQAHPKTNQPSIKTAKHLYDLIVIKRLALAILSNATPFLRALHDLVDSDLDGDRLDYVIRDQAASGISHEPLRFKRLVQSFTLVKISDSKPARPGKQKTLSATFAFVPSVRALSTIEDFYSQRFQLYKYVVYHHRVSKFDGLLQNCVLTLAKEYLEHSESTKNRTAAKESSTPEKEARQGDGILLNSDISGLWQVLHSDVFTFSSQLVDYYIQWDDSWLLTVLRKHHAVLRKERGSGKKKFLEIQLEELLSNRKKYYSLYKRGECFLEIDKEFMLAFAKKFDWKRLSSSAPADKATAEDIERLKKYIRTVRGLATGTSKKEELTRMVENNGYCLSLIFRLLIRLGICTPNELPFAKDAAAELKCKPNGVDDVIFIPKLIKPGIKKYFHSPPLLLTL